VNGYDRVFANLHEIPYILSNSNADVLEDTEGKSIKETGVVELADHFKGRNHTGFRREYRR
tara:strand:- start:838 stop:1020 length:183 start_codon:yes stop_codon:yes gene_type:complete